MPKSKGDLGKPIVDGILRYTSVSAMALYEACPAKYVFRYVLGRPGDESPVLDFGTAAHERLERFQRGEPVELGPCEKEMLLYIPRDCSDALIEQPLHEGLVPLYLGSVPMVGWADRIDINELLPDAICTDWKFKGNISRWAANPVTLTDAKDQDGRQMIAAAKWTTNNFPVNGVKVRHVTSQTGGIDAEGAPKGPFRAIDSVGAIMDRPEIEAKWRAITAQFEEPLKAAARAKSPADVAGNTKNCFKYGRPCPYIDECPHKGKTMKAIGPLIPHIQRTQEAQADYKAAQPGQHDARPAITLYFGGSHPLNQPAHTLHGTVKWLEEQLLQALLGDKYQPAMDVRTVKHASLEFGKWKVELGAYAKKRLPDIAAGHYLVPREEKCQVVADALLPLVAGGVGPI